MKLTIEDIDGRYEVKSGPVEGSAPPTVDGDGITEIKNGLTYRKDKNGLIWESAFTLLEDGRVQMESTVDPSHAGNATYLRDEKGNLTSGMLTFRTVFDVSEKDGKLVFTGIIEHGEQKTRVVMTRL